MRKSGGVRDEVREEGRGGGSEQALDLDQDPYQCFGTGYATLHQA